MLDYRIETFLSLCETKSYTRTSQVLHVTQPAVTRHIQYLEEYYGCRFFHYDEHRNLQLTENGQYLYEKMKGMQVNSKAIYDYLQMKEHMEHPRFTIGMTPIATASSLPNRIVSYMKQNPVVHLDFRVCDVVQLQQDLINGKLDFGFMEYVAGMNNMLVYMKYGQQMLYPFAAPELAERLYNVPVKRLLGETLLLPPPNSGLREATISALHKQNIEITDFQDCISVTEGEMMQQLLVNGMGIAFLFDFMVREGLKQKARRIYIEDFSIENTFYFVYLKNRFSEKRHQETFDNFLKQISEMKSEY